MVGLGALENKMHIKKDYSIFIRNFTFGVEDSLVSTVGLLVGIAVAGVDQKSIIITGLVLIFVEAFSMAIGSLISERSVETYEAKGNISYSKPLKGGITMLFSYIAAGLIPLSPYFYSANTNAVIASIILTLIALFMLGAISARMFRSKVWRDGLFTFLMGTMAIVVGIVVGQLADKF
jgi:VIT1/CCC1 family predicted Fe2+/Mn2+ transporter